MNTSLRSSIIAVALAAVSSLTACASSTQSSRRTLAQTTAAVYRCGSASVRGVVRGATNGWTATDISNHAELAGQSAYEAVLRLRPEYLEARAPGGSLGTKA